METHPARHSGTPPPELCLAGGGTMGALMRAFDWSRTPLGPVASWPQSLRTTVSTCLNSRFPILVWWGPKLVKIYNDAYMPILASKHPGALGCEGRDVWPEIWHLIGPMLEGVLSHGEATWSENSLLPLERHGFAEECYFTFSYSPIQDEAGAIGGIFTAVTETTRQILSERRLRLLRELGNKASGTSTVGGTCDALAEVLRPHAADIPFALVYLSEEGASSLRPAAFTGVSSAPPALASATQIGRDDLPIVDLELALGARLEVTAALSPTRAIALPIAHSGDPKKAGLLIVGLSPRLVFDDGYRDFLGLVAKQISSALDTVRALEETKKRAEALAEIDRAKTTFFGNVSHEFRTPITLMLGPTGDALASDEGTLERPAVEMVHRNGLRLLKLVNSLLDFARIEAGRVQASYEPTDLAALTTDLASAFRSAVERAGLIFDVRFDPLPEPVYVDHDMWEKIVLNLLSNALKFTFEGGIRVRLAWRGDSTELTVGDTGVGIAVDDLPRLFERFHRIEGTRSRTHEGSGIGLALVHELVRLHGGEIGATSAPAEGTTFTVSIPAGCRHLPADRIAAVNANAPMGRDAAPFVEEALRWSPETDTRPSVEGDSLRSMAPSSKDFVAARVLVADDNADMREYVQRILSPRWSVETATDGLAALAQIQAGLPDLVVTDVMMPNLDGFGLLRSLRADPRTKRIPVIFLSARAGEEARAHGLESGADDYLVKPFAARELLARVEAQLTHARIRHFEEQQAQHWKSIFQNAPVGIAILRGPTHIYEFANDDFLRLLSNRPILGKPITLALPELAGQGIYELLDKVFTTGEPHRTHSTALVIHRADGVPEERYFSFVCQPMREADRGITGVVAVVTEVSELARARRDAEVASRAKDDFLAMLGHELRNPLAPIRTALEIMKLRGDENQRERTVIERQVKHLMRLVDDLLDVSRVTRGNIELKRERIEIAEVLAKAVEMSSPVMDQRGQSLSVDVARTGLTVDGDPTRLAQVFSNLLINAAKYTDAGGRIELSARSQGEEVLVEVRDSGVGIAPDMLPKIFDLFAQEHQSIDRSQGGLGLGLAIVMSLIKLHGGSITAHSDGRGQGSRFTARLPRVAIPVPVTQSTKVGAGLDQAPGKGRRVLIVDDNRDAADLLSSFLQLRGYRVAVAYDGPTALALIGQFVPELALLDIGLPVMNGYELAQRLRERSELRTTKLVAITGYGQETDRMRSHAAGFDEHVVKPLDMKFLGGVLERLTGDV